MYKKLFVLLSLLMLGALSSSASVSLPSPSDVPHPRLFLGEGREKDVLKSIGKMESVRICDSVIVSWAGRYLSTPLLTLPGDPGKGASTNDTFCEGLRRLFFLSYAWRVHGDRRYADRALEEAREICSWPYWNNPWGSYIYQLNNGEILLGLAIMYDWLFPLLSDEDKALVRKAMISNGFEPAFHPKAVSIFTTNRTNWNQVCTGGLVCAALAVFEDEPEWALKILERTSTGNAAPQKMYAPYGAYPEGHSYWSYGSCFEVLLLDALGSVLGDDFGLSECPGFLESPRFVDMMARPTGSAFNYSDSGSMWSASPATSWFAWKTGDKSLLYQTDLFYRTRTVFAHRLLPMHVIFCSRLKGGKIRPSRGNVYLSDENTFVFAYRSGWDSPDDAYLGIKAGASQHNHCHMDVGEFVYSNKGVDWSVDLGSNDYNLGRRYLNKFFSNSQTSERWKSFRCTADSHSVLQFDGAYQNVTGVSLFTDVFRGGDGRFGASVDLTPTYEGQVRSVSRTAWVDRSGDLTVVDRVVTGDAARDYSFTLQTPATPRIVSDGSVLLLCKGKAAEMGIDAGGNPCSVEILKNGYENAPWDRKEPSTCCRVRFHVAIPACSTAEITTTIKCK